ncbi:MAG: MerR family transcriptional regulator [Chloroflexota bacterium]
MYQRHRPQVGEQTRIPSQAPPGRPDHTSLARPESPESPRNEPRGAATDDQVRVMEGVYIISVAARILDVHPQTLRKYERLGLINPGRTIGMLRLYSREDIRKVRLIQLLGNMGLNLAGVEFALSTVDNLLLLKQRLTALVGGSPLERLIDEEVASVFLSLNLPVED